MAFMTVRRPLALNAQWRAALAFGLVAVLLWAPISAHWHGIAHQLRQAMGAPAVTAPASADVDGGHAQGSALCQVLDHLGHASALPAWPVQAALYLFPAHTPEAKHNFEVTARPCWRRQARAPPERT
jgi:hypothetical protein